MAVLHSRPSHHHRTRPQKLVFVVAVAMNVLQVPRSNVARPERTQRINGLLSCYVYPREFTLRWLCEDMLKIVALLEELS